MSLEGWDAQRWDEFKVCWDHKGSNPRRLIDRNDRSTIIGTSVGYTHRPIKSASTIDLNQSIFYLPNRCNDYSWFITHTFAVSTKCIENWKCEASKKLNSQIDRSSWNIYRGHYIPGHTSVATPQDQMDAFEDIFTHHPDSVHQIWKLSILIPSIVTGCHLRSP